MADESKKDAPTVAGVRTRLAGVGTRLAGIAVAVLLEFNVEDLELMCASCARAGRAPGSVPLMPVARGVRERDRSFVAAERGRC